METERARLVVAPLGLTVFALPCAAFWVWTLRHFYILGGFWGDSGAIAAVLWHNGWALRAPLVHGGGSFLSTHTALTLLPITGLSWVVPLTRAGFFAAFTGVCHALPAIVVYSVLVREYRLRPLLAAAGGLAFGFNGLAIAIARNPHFELLFSATAVLFLLGLLREQRVLTWLSFLACVFTREDSGLHLFGLLAVLTAVQRWQGMAWRAQSRLLVFAALALACGVVSLLVQRVAFPDGGHSLGGVYIGDPPFAEITPGVVTERLAFWILYRPYLILPAVAACAWAVRIRDPMPVVGYAAFVPWALLHLFARSELAGTLSNYYPFPFIVAAAWPLLGAVLRQRRLGLAAPGWHSAAAFGLMTVLSFAGLDRQHNPGQLDVPESFLRAPSWAQQQATDRALAALAASTALGVVAVDAGVASLQPDAYRAGDTITHWASGAPDTILYFVRGFEAPQARDRADQAGLTWHFAVPGTAIRVASNRALDGLAGLVPDADWR